MARSTWGAVAFVSGVGGMACAWASSWRAAARTAALGLDFVGRFRFAGFARAVRVGARFAGLRFAGGRRAVARFAGLAGARRVLVRLRATRRPELVEGVVVLTGAWRAERGARGRPQGEAVQERAELRHVRRAVLPGLHLGESARGERDGDDVRAGGDALRDDRGDLGVERGLDRVELEPGWRQSRERSAALHVASPALRVVPVGARSLV